ncbi:MAG: hypothetical protein JXR25_13290 [Pontiellaceae bacterium]|nr:hypothetical protein [Candidatus Anaeroferrophillacea bacterium]MBN2785789.1 hypothetical protein [Pontiellaceae bacterium]
MNHRTIITIFIITVIFITGCSTIPKVDQNQLAIGNGSVIDGKTVKINYRIRQHYWKEGFVHSIGQRPEPEEIETKDYDAERELKSGIILADMEINLGTRQILQRFEPVLERALRAAGAQLDNDNHTYSLIAELCFGPTPAPAYSVYELGKSVGVSLMTLGLGPKKYELHNDYTLKLCLTEHATGNVIKQHEYVADDSYLHNIHSLDIGAHKRSIEAACDLFEDSLEGFLTDFFSNL